MKKFFALTILSAFLSLASYALTPILGPSSTCVGTPVMLTDSPSVGGMWSSSNAVVAGIDSISGMVYPHSAGVTTITYTYGGSSVTMTFTVNASPAAIVGSSTVCVGSTITLTDATSGGVWSSSYSAVATVGSATGVVTGVSAGTCTIFYSVGGCYASQTITVLGSGSVDTISGTTSMLVGGTASLFDATPGGSWSSSNTAIATISSSGIVTGVSAGTATITYTVTSCGTAYATTTVTVSALNRISGNVLFGGVAPDSGATLKIWLIKYDTGTHMLSAVDSVTTFPFGTSVYYQFLGEPADSYRVKAAVIETPYVATGYIPTYHINHFYWHDADVINHSAPGTDDGNDINMAYGSVPTGPGFIAGDVTTGANKGTSGGAPAVGLQILLLNSTGAVIEKAITDASGHYSFSSLPLGTYTIFPEAISYLTTAYTGITLTSASSSVSYAGFIQHTVSHTITPHTTGINNLQPSVSSVFAFPNPTTGKLNIQWNEMTSEKATISIADVTGREVYSNTIQMNKGAGSMQLDLSALTNGLYLVNVHSTSINYNSKIQIQH